MARTKQTKKKNRRNQDKFSALDPAKNLKSRFEEIEDLASYANSLSQEDRAWLNQFAKEYICCETKNMKLFKGKKRRKICTDRNNARNRCILSREKAQGTLNYLEDLSDKDSEERDSYLGASEEFEGLVDGASGKD